MADIISGIRAALRPMAKEMIKGGLVAIDTLTEFVAEAGEQIKDLIAEAKAELAERDGVDKGTSNPKGQNGSTK
jgi:Protein of unknown function (DUF5132)